MPFQHVRRFALATVIVAASCSGGAGNVPPQTPLPQVESVVQPQAVAAATPMPSTIVLKAGAINGIDNRFSPVDSDTAHGGNGQTVDGIPCATTMYETNYHVHAFVGIIVNKQEIALPDAIGLYGYGPETSGVTNAARCYYYLHTHDASGMVHVESPAKVSLGSGVYTLGDFLDVWGEAISTTAFGPFAGPVHVFVAKPPLRSLYSGPFTAYTGNPRSIVLYSHEAIWIEVGSSYYTAAQLAQIRFYTEY